MSETIAEAVRRAVTTRQLCDALGVELDRRGNALCPFHPDKKSRSLKVYEDPARGWHCFGCGMGGTVIDFAMAWYGISFRQAVVRLDADFGLNLPLTRRPTAADRRIWAENEQKRALERKREEIAAREAEAAYWACFDRYLACARMMDENRPGRGGEIPEKYAEAARLLPEIRDEYERALDRWEGTRRANFRARGGDRQMDEGGLPEKLRAV